MNNQNFNMSNAGYNNQMNFLHNQQMAQQSNMNYVNNNQINYSYPQIQNTNQIRDKKDLLDDLF